MGKYKTSLIRVQVSVGSVQVSMVILYVISVPASAASWVNMKEKNRIKNILFEAHRVWRVINGALTANLQWFCRTESLQVAVTCFQKQKQSIGFWEGWASPFDSFIWLYQQCVLHVVALHIVFCKEFFLLSLDCPVVPNSGPPTKTAKDLLLFNSNFPDRNSWEKKNFDYSKTYLVDWANRMNGQPPSVFHASEVILTRSLTSGSF